MATTKLPIDGVFDKDTGVFQGLAVPGGSLVQVNSGAASGPRALSPYMGFVANRLAVPTRLETVNKQVEVSTKHWWRDDVPQGSTVRILEANWCNLTPVYTPSGNGEVGTGGDMLLQSWVFEYPIGGPRYQVIANATITNGTTGQFDIQLPFTAVRGTPFKVRRSIRMQGSGFLPYWAPGGGNSANNGTALGEGWQVAASGLTDLTLSGEPTANTGVGTCPVLGIIAMTSRPTYIAVEDSRGAGSGDTMTVDGLMGNSNRYLGSRYGGLSMAGPGEYLRDHVTGNSRRRVLLQYASDIINAMGINDLANGRSLAQLQTDMQTWIAQASANKNAQARVYLGTLQPYTTSTDNWATVGNQTVFAQNGNRNSFNDWVRSTMLSGVDGYIDYADPVEFGNNSGKWHVNQGATTADGLHANRFGYGLVESSNVIASATGL